MYYHSAICREPSNGRLQSKMWIHRYVLLWNVILLLILFLCDNQDGGGTCFWKRLLSLGAIIAAMWKVMRAVQVSSVPQTEHTENLFTITNIVVVYAVCTSCEDGKYQALLRMVSVFLLPLALARESSSVRIFIFEVGAHFMFTAFRFRSEFFTDGWQWLLVLTIIDVTLVDMLMLKEEDLKRVQVLHVVHGMIATLLDSICDASLLLQRDGRVAAMDGKAIDFFGMHSLSNSYQGDVHFNSFLDDGAKHIDDDCVCPGLVKSTLKGQQGTRFKVEVFTMPCPDSLLGQMDPLRGGWRSPSATLPLDLRCIRVINEIQEQKKTDQNVRVPTRVPTPTWDEDAEKYKLNGRLPKAPAPSELVLSPKKEDDSVHLGPWKMIQALGLGAGNYKLLKRVANGSQGTVYEAKATSGARCAVKRINLPGMIWQRDFTKRLQSADREARILKDLAWASSVVVSLQDCWIENDFKVACLVMEWLPHTLAEALKIRRDRGEGPPTLATTCRWLTQMATGIAAIHTAGFLHRDIKPSNILMDEVMDRCKVADLGVGRPLVPNEHNPSSNFFLPDQASVVSDDENHSVVSGSILSASVLSAQTVKPGCAVYSSREALESGKYSCPMDIFSLGCVLLEMLSLKLTQDIARGEGPRRVSVRSQAEVILADLVPTDPSQTNLLRKLRNFCLQMLSDSPASRPSAYDLVTSSSLRVYFSALLQENPELSRIAKTVRQ